MRLETLPVSFCCPGQHHNSIAAPDVIEGIDMEARLADKGFDNNRVRELLRLTQTQAVIPPKADRKDPSLVISPCIDGGISSRTSSAISNSSEVSHHVTTRQMKASPRSSSSERSI